MTLDELQRRVEDVKSVAVDCFEQVEKALELRDDLLFSVMTEDELASFHWLEPEHMDERLSVLMSKDELTTFYWLNDVIDRTARECVAALEN